MADRISSSSRRELPPSGSRPFWRTSEGGPQKIAVLARCGIHLALFMLLAEFDGPDTLWVRFAVRVSYDGDGSGRAVLPGVELSQQIEMRGRVVIANHYAGCPWCGGESIFRCGCGAMNCSGASRTHGDHQDRYCASCRGWQCVRSAASLKELSGFAQVEPRSRADASHPRTVGREDRPQLPPGRTIMRRG